MHQTSLPLSRKLEAIHYSRDEVIGHLFQDGFGLSENNCSGDEGVGIYAYLGSLVVDCDMVAALRRVVASDPVVGLSPAPSGEAFDGYEDQLDFF